MSSERSLEARQSLDRVQNFDVTTLPRDAELGQAFSFKDTVQPATRAIGIFKKIPLDFLEDLPDEQLKKIKSTADAFFSHLGSILSFDSTQENAVGVRSSIIKSTASKHQEIFNDLHHTISYLASRQHDVSSLQRDFHAAIQDAKDRAEQLQSDLSQEREMKRKESSQKFARLRPSKASHRKPAISQRKAAIISHMPMIGENIL